MFLGEDSEYEVPYSTIKCGIIKSVRNRPQGSWQEYMMLVYCGTGIPSIAMRSWRKWFWRICIVHMKQNVTLHNAQVSHLINMWLWGASGTEKIWNCCCHPQIFAWYPFLPLCLSSIAPGSTLSCWTVRAMFFAPEYGEGDYEMPPGCHFHELVFWWGHPRVWTWLVAEKKNNCVSTTFD